MSKPTNNLWQKARYRIETDQGQTFIITVSGRDRWALESLLTAGPTGCTPIDKPGPRWAAYVHNLRKLGLLIETMNEPHSGPFTGTHARYVLRCNARLLKGFEAAA